MFILKVLLYNLKQLSVSLSSDAKVNIRDYHGKMAAHYWSGSKDIFTEHRSHSGMYYYSVLHIYRSMFITMTNKIILCIVSTSLCCCIGCLRWLTAVLLHSAGSWPRGRRAQCYSQLSALLSRSQSNRNISAETSSRPLERHPIHTSPSSWYTLSLNHCPVIVKYSWSEWLND